MPPSPPQVDVIDDPREIASSRQAYEVELDRSFAAALDLIRSGKPVFFELRAALVLRGDRAATELRLILADESAMALARVRAAELLASFGHTDGEAFLLAALDAKRPDLCAAAVAVLDHWSSRITGNRPDIAPRILELLNSSSDLEVIRGVLHLCRSRDLPGAEQVLLKARSRLWALEPATTPQEPATTPQQPVRAKRPRPQVPLRQRVIETLAHLATTPASMIWSVPFLFVHRDKKYTAMARTTYGHILRHPDPVMSGLLRSTLRNHLLSYEGDDRLGQHWAGDFAAVAKPGDEPILEDIVARAKDPVSRAYAIQGLVRLAPEGAVERILTELQRDRSWRDTLLALLREQAAETDFERVTAVLYPAGNETKKRPLGEADARLLLEKFGSRGRQFIQENRERFDEHGRRWLTWKLEGLDIFSAVAELHAAGVIALNPEEVIARLQKHKAKHKKPWDPSEPSLFTNAIDVADVTVGFDTETGRVPCKHDELILQFARATGGRFALECPVQTWHRQHKQDFKAPYTVQFIYRDRLFRFTARNHGDYYDVPAVVLSLNGALEYSGQPERFIGLYTGDQCAYFVFANPGAFIPIAKKYGIPVSYDPSEAMNAGRDFEQHVLKALGLSPPKS